MIPPRLRVRLLLMKSFGCAQDVGVQPLQSGILHFKMK
jgi:hypothetical protein